jgi:hypothetical protein
MEKPTYNVKSSDDGLKYFFESINDDKIIKKVVAYLPTAESPNLYQLIFGDLLPNGEIDVFSNSNNQDMRLVLTTVVGTLAEFFEKYPRKTVAFTGSTNSRTRLYRAAITKFIQTTELYYQVLGILEDDSIENFNPNHQYYAYLIKQKDGKY